MTQIIKDNIRPRASAILDTFIQEGKWLSYVEGIDREGRFTRKRQLELIVLLLEHVERLEQVVERLGFDIETLQSQLSKKK